jgi:hypothetical protein
VAVHICSAWQKLKHSYSVQLLDASADCVEHVIVPIEKQSFMAVLAADIIPATASTPTDPYSVCQDCYLVMPVMQTCGGISRASTFLVCCWLLLPVYSAV